MNNLIFIGPLRQGQTPRGGDTMKNTLFLKRFREVFKKVYVVDTIDWRKKPFIIVKMLWYLTFIHNAKVVISCEEGASRIIDFLYYIRLQKDVFYWVVGSGFPTRIANGSSSPKHYSFLKKIMVQSHNMVKSLNEAGLNNVLYVPNSKPIYDIPIEQHCGRIRFVFLSRILPEKGIEQIFGSVERLNAEGMKDDFEIDFYGMVGEKYFTFEERVETIPNVTYRGVLDLTKEEGYQKLAIYDAMLFPTFYEGEGFPGVFIDAFISALPVIASDWHCNTEIIEDKKTGFIIPPKDEEALYDKMKMVIKHREILLPMKLACKKEAKKYDRNNILNEANLQRIGLLE